jgi:hypothetical protein
MSAEVGPKRLCRTCAHPRSETEFYNGCAECKTCKRSRSKRNRALQARKLAAFERFVDVLVTLADRTDAQGDAQFSGEAA